MGRETVRLYRMADELMLTRASVQHSILEADLALFTVKFPWLDAAYLSSYAADIATADAVGLDYTETSDVRVFTADVMATMVEARKALQALFGYAKLAYAEDKARQRVFGQARLKRASNVPAIMESLLEHANSMANKAPYHADLLAKGYTQTEIDNLLTIADELSTKKTLQEGEKSNRPVSTADRIKIYNIVFGRMRIIRICSQVVFAGNREKIQQYLLYPPEIAGKEIEM
ncbi:MAG TPA: hypothetical protein VI757_11620 [Bacteroidia bacterium]|nr:hypothetical protein [Bacteroidia bacterium]